MASRFSATALLYFALMAPIPAQAQVSQDSQDCFAGDSVSPDDAIAACTRAIGSGRETENNLSIAYSNRGHNFLRKRDIDSAIKDFDQAIRINPRNAQAWTNRGEAYQRKDNFQKAISDHTEAIRLDPKQPDAWFNRGIAYQNSGDKVRAIADYRQALKVNPNDEDARRQLQKLGGN